MEIIAAILGALIAATLTIIVMGVMNSYAIDRETEIIRKKMGGRYRGRTSKMQPLPRNSGRICRAS